MKEFNIWNLICSLPALLKLYRIQLIKVLTSIPQKFHLSWQIHFHQKIIFHWHKKYYQSKLNLEIIISKIIAIILFHTKDKFFNLPEIAVIIFFPLNKSFIAKKKSIKILIPATWLFQKGDNFRRFSRKIWFNMGDIFI